MMTHKYTFYVLCVFALGCSEKDDAMHEEQLQDSVFESQIRSIDRAGEIEQQIEDAAAKQRQAIEEQGG